MPLWSMSTKQNQIEHIKSKSNIVTIEDHLQDGGFGSWLLEANSFNNVGNVSIETKALNHNVCGTVGSQATLNKMGGIAK